MVDLVKVEIVFENCDSVSLHRDILFSFWVNDIREEYYLVSNAIVHNKKIDQSYLCINKSLIKFTKTEFNSNLLERLEKYKDITHYYLHLSDLSVIKLSLPWIGNSDDINESEFHYHTEEWVKITHNFKPDHILDLYSDKII